jgi:phenylacetate-CoA ligase
MTDLGSLGIESENHPGSLTVLETESIAEVIDPATGAPTQPGQIGELVMTNLGRIGQPVLRYRTGDLVKASLDLSAGEGELRLEGGVLGRSDDMLIIRGNNVFPSSVEAVLRSFPEVAEFRLSVVKRQEMLQLRIEFEPVPELSETRDALDQLVNRMGRRITERLAFLPELQPVECGSLPRAEFKRQRVTKLLP